MDDKHNLKLMYVVLTLAILATAFVLYRLSISYQTENLVGAAFVSYPNIRSGELESGKAAGEERSLNDLIIVDIEELGAASLGSYNSISELQEAQKTDQSLREEGDTLIARLIRDRAFGVPESDLDKLDFVVFYQQAGRLITPELDRTAEPSEIAKVSNKLTFTFNSPAEPWTAEEISSMEKWIKDFYPIIKKIYGPPAFTNTVNIRRDISIGFSGGYDSYFNEIILSFAPRTDVLVHELIHAFRDDLTIGDAAFEEGMTRAVEIEVFNQHNKYLHPWDDHHSYVWDIYYELLNVPDVAPVTSFWDGFNPLMRYQLSGYAWWKLYAENPAFFKKFNRAYFLQAHRDSTVRYDQEKLWQIVFSIQKNAEGLPIAEWKKLQYIFSKSAPIGTRIFLVPEGYFGGSLFSRNENGYIEKLPNEIINFKVTDTNGTTLLQDTLITDSYGTFYLGSAGLESYKGAVMIEATSPTYGVTNSLVDMHPPISTRCIVFKNYTADIEHSSCVGGATAPPLLAQTVTIQSIKRRVLSQTISVENGAYISEPKFERGSYRILFRNAAGEIFNEKIITKDDTWYAVRAVK